MEINKNNFVNHSGGANGADSKWDEIGRQYGFNNNNHYWLNKKTPKGNYEISVEDAAEGQIMATEAARQLGRIEDTHQIRNELVIRNWCQVKYSDAIYAIGTITNAGEQLKYGKIAKIIQVSGGTGYAVQMAANVGKPVYFFEQNLGRWYRYFDHKWEISDVPTLTTNYAGIGTRQISDLGIEAIHQVFTKTVNSTSS